MSNKFFQKAVNYLFLIYTFFLPLIFFTKTSEIFEFNKIVFTYFFTILIVGVWLGRCVYEKRIVFKKTLADLPLLLFLLTYLLCSLNSIDPHTSFFGFYSRFNGGFYSYLSYALLYWSFVSNFPKKQIHLLLNIIITSCLFVSLYGIAQHFGIDKDLWVQDVQARVFSTLGQPNWLAAYLSAIIFIPISLAYFAKKNFRIFYIIVSAIFFLVILFTKSRSGLIATVISGLFFYFSAFIPLLIKKSKPKFLKRIFVTNAVTFLTFLLISVFSGTPWTRGFLLFEKDLHLVSPQETAAIQNSLNATDSGDIRKIVWKGAWNIWKANPVFGTGVETFAYSYYKFKPVEQNLTSEWDFLYNKAHNEYLNFLATTGILGTATYLILILAFLTAFALTLYKNLLRDNSQSEMKLWFQNLALLSGFLSILITNFFGFSVVTTSAIFFILPAISAVTNSAIDKNLKIKNPNFKQALLFFVIGFIGLSIGFRIFSYWLADFYYSKGLTESRSENFELASNWYTKAIDKNPYEPIYYDALSTSKSNTALIKNEAGEEASDIVNSAVAANLKAIKLSPENVTWVRSQANLYVKLSAIDPDFLSLARNSFQHAFVMAPNDAKTVLNLGVAYARTGETEKALGIIEHAVYIKPDYKEARFSLAILYKDLGFTEKAKEQLNYILEKIDPSDLDVRRELNSLK